MISYVADMGIGDGGIGILEMLPYLGEYLLFARMIFLFMWKYVF